MGCTSWVFSSQACRPVQREGFLIENCVTAPEKVEQQVELELGLKILKKYMEFTGICWWIKKAFAGFPRQHIAETSSTTQVTTPHLRCNSDWGSEDHLSSDVLRTYVRATRRQRIAICLQRAGPSNSRRRWYGCWKFLKEPWNLGIRWVVNSCDNCYIFRQLYKCSASPLIISFRGSSQGRAKIFTEWLCFSHLGVP